jgi:hypothetical protein
MSGSRFGNSPILPNRNREGVAVYIPVDHRCDTSGEFAVLLTGQCGDDVSQVSAGLERGDGVSIPVPFMQRDSGGVNNPAGQGSRENLLVATPRENKRHQRFASPQDDVNVRTATNIATVGGYGGVIPPGGVQYGLEHRRELSSQSLRLVRKSAGNGASDMIVDPDIEQFTCLPNGIERYAPDGEGEHGKAGNQANAR